MNAVYAVAQHCDAAAYSLRSKPRKAERSRAKKKSPRNTGATLGNNAASVLKCTAEIRVLVDHLGQAFLHFRTQDDTSFQVTRRWQRASAE